MVPIGGILVWSGSEVDIPAGFSCCDGTNGTPDLREKFVRSAGAAIAAGSSGGETSHSHVRESYEMQDAGTDTAVWTGTTTEDADHIPPYYALFYIMRTQ